MFNCESQIMKRNEKENANLNFELPHNQYKQIKMGFNENLIAILANSRLNIIKLLKTSTYL